MRIDGELSAIFAIIVALDAVMSVPGNTVVFNRALFGEWRASSPSSRSQLQIVSPLSPLWTSIAAPLDAGDSSQRLEHFAERHARSIKSVRVLRLLGFAELFLLVIAVPWAVATYSGVGLLVALFVTLVVCSLGAIVAGREWKALNAGARPKLRRVLAWCSPFSAPRAAEDVLREAFNGATAAIVAHVMLSRGRFHEWVRPLAYDHLIRDRRSQIDGLMTKSEMDAIVQGPPDARDPETASYCPRCGHCWVISTGRCDTCDVELEPVSVRPRQSS